ncbi:zinc finger CCHC domain-containing protein 3-like [Bufo gargarizans]|uniref:zinc finger CCHC domain-containing protein 3-like n=1 Tax=Bufo gargarizans TaxID=30331 RepID=UPI001CF1EF7D|nr:zinc finger CCHC domain-containing protein 3-like [Bufo gargarizans]
MEVNIQDPQSSIVSGTQRSGADTGGSAGQSGVSKPVEERPSTDPPADRPQFRRLFSNVTRPANPPPQRRNAVRIKYTGPEEDLPSRLYIGKILLKDFIKFKASEVYTLIHIPSSRIYDISFKLQYDLDLLWNIYNDTKKQSIWEHLQVIQLSKPQVVRATILFQSEVVALADLEHCHSEKIYDEEDIWNGGYTVMIQLAQNKGVTRHLPHSFYLGSERGICYYPGQPRLCHRCGGRHLFINCSRIKCSFCGQFGHSKDDCT